MMGKKDRERAEQTGKVHRSGQEVEKPPEPEICAIPHCSKPVNDFLAERGLPVCPMHGDMILTMRHVWFLMPGLAESATDAPRPDGPQGSGLVVVRNKGQEDAALRDIGRKMGRG
jgi:hypothetical protein